jgi:hypothetical protein
MLSNRFFIKILLFAKTQKYSSLHPPQTQKAPHRLKGWCDALRKLLRSAAGCHITGPVALRRSLSTGLPILLFLCGNLHKNHKTFFFFLSTTPKHLWQVAQKRQCLYNIFG